jgi:hypothetical protein
VGGSMKNLELSRLAELIVEAYPDPSPCDTREEFARFLNDDVPGLSLEDLDRERIVARLRWAFDGDSSWLRERLQRLDREAATRRRQ